MVWLESVWRPYQSLKGKSDSQLVLHLRLSPTELPRKTPQELQTLHFDSFLPALAECHHEEPLASKSFSSSVFQLSSSVFVCFCANHFPKLEFFLLKMESPQTPTICQSSSSAAAAAIPVGANRYQWLGCGLCAWFSRLSPHLTLLERYLSILFANF